MGTMAARRIFLDTNVLIRASIDTAPLHTIARERIATLEQRRAELWISRQVLREYLAVLSRPQAWSAPPCSAQ